MRLCFEFLGSAKDKPRQVELSDFKAMQELCDERRASGKTGFLVRADTLSEAVQTRANAPEDPGGYFIL